VTAKRNVIVVGASAAGLRCASRLARLQPHWRVRVIEARETFSWAACGLPYVLSGDIPDAEALRRTHYGAVRDAAYFASVKGVEVLAGHRAVDVDAQARTLTVRDGDGSEQFLEWDELVLATGAAPVRLPGQPDHPRVTAFHTPEDMLALHARLAGGTLRRAVIVGAGLVGCELAEAFVALWGAEVALLEAGPTPLPGLLDPEVGALAAAALRGEDVDLRLGVAVEGIDADDDGVRVHLADGATVEGDVAVVAVGVRPEIELAAAAGVRLGPTGAVAVDERLATSTPHVWAAGDAAELRHAPTGGPAHFPLGSLANRQGRTLANILAGRDDTFGPVAGAAAVKIFDLNVAATGLTRTAGVAAGLAARSVWISAFDAADYWPESKEIALQLTYDPDTGHVLGVQAAGAGEVAKRIDTATQCLLRGATLAELAHLEHAYAPPYAPALDPLAVAAMVALNREDGVEPLGPLDLPAGAGILDVRHEEESEARPLDGPDVTRLPLESLRDRVADLDLRPWIVVCERGTRSAEAARRLRARGADATYLGGGLRWRSLAGQDSQQD